MSMDASLELRSIRQTAERFAGKELEPGALDRENYPYAALPESAIRTAGELGMLALTLPEEFGGSGQGMQALCAILETFAEADAGFAALVLTNSLAQAALLGWGGTARLVGLDPAKLVAFPIYDLPSDLPGDLTAEKRGDIYRLRGKVEYLALAPLASSLLVPAQASESGKPAFFVVPPQTHGLTVGKPLLSLGLRTCPVADLEFDEVRLPAGSLLCEDAGQAYPLLACRFRPAVAAIALGVLKSSYRNARAYAQERYQGGRTIIEHDQVRLMLTNMAVIAEAGTALVESMAMAGDEDRHPALNEAGLILLTEQASRATTDGVQVLGGYGYMQDYGQEKRMRDAKQIETIFGPAQAKRLELADRLLAE